MPLNHYRFRSVWPLDHPPDVVWDVLEDVLSYPVWWPEVRLAEQVEPAATALTCRSLLPYDLRFTIRSSRQDAAAGVLEAHLSGDLDGFSRWTLSARDGGCTAVFDEEVTTTKPVLRALSPVARPAFRANHRLMMRHGRHGLRAYLTSRAASPPP